MSERRHRVPRSARTIRGVAHLSSTSTARRFNTDLPNSTSMKAEKQPELRWQCLNCYKTYKGPDAEQKALDCCGSIVQGWWANYNKWGRQKWYGR